ncbi:MAG: Unknown protein [uncultured Sulfurovum sp.]|uniref:Uncharacterized protein n=1 Tax=uncultured Sulfurovum sp. TaxID=269237 RepID=A0A6S6SXY9_9BACT|nr:MAG: Unknown protein [uncultured Sulfurovum sp.]
MKKILIVLLITTFGLYADKGSIKVCQSYIDQVKAFEKEMGNDKISQKTLAFYKEKMKIHCGGLASKKKFEKKEFAEMMSKNENHTTAECKEAIEMASKYSERKTQSIMIVAAHKENIADNCGSLMAAHVSAYCLFGEE